jgi:hypothetical protein
MQAQCSGPVEKKGKMADTRKDDAESADDRLSPIEMLLADLKQPM